MSEVEKRPREDEEAAVGEAKKAKAEPLFAASDVAAGPEPLAPAQADAVAKLLAFYFGDANLRRDKTEHNDIGLYMAGAKEQPVRTETEKMA